MRVDNVFRRQSNIIPKHKLFLGVEDIAVRLPKYLCVRNVFASAFSSFRLPIGGRGLSFFFLLANQEVEATGGCR